MIRAVRRGLFRPSWKTSRATSMSAASASAVRRLGHTLVPSCVAAVSAEPRLGSPLRKLGDDRSDGIGVRAARIGDPLEAEVNSVPV